MTIPNRLLYSDDCLNVLNDELALPTGSVDRFDATAGVMVCFNRHMRTVENQRSKATFRYDSDTYPVIQGYTLRTCCRTNRSPCRCTDAGAPAGGSTTRLSCWRPGIDEGEALHVVKIPRLVRAGFVIVFRCWPSQNQEDNMARFLANELAPHEIHSGTCGYWPNEQNRFWFTAFSFSEAVTRAKQLYGEAEFCGDCLDAQKELNIDDD